MIICWQFVLITQVISFFLDMMRWKFVFALDLFANELNHNNKVEQCTMPVINKCSQDGKVINVGKLSRSQSAHQQILHQQQTTSKPIPIHLSRWLNCLGTGQLTLISAHNGLKPAFYDYLVETPLQVLFLWDFTSLMNYVLQLLHYKCLESEKENAVQMVSLGTSWTYVYLFQFLRGHHSHCGQNNWNQDIS